MLVLFPMAVSLPVWFQVGVLGGIAIAALAGVLFYLGDRLFPAPRTGQRGDGGEARPRAAIRAYLTEIGEEFVEGYTVHGVEVAFFLPERSVAITFDALGHFRLTREGIHTVLVEHEMPVSHLSWRLPFETPDRDPGTPWNGTASPDRHEAYATLGVSPTASPEQLREAYRERVKEAHPDHGGDVDSFRRLRQAYVEAKQGAR